MGKKPKEEKGQLRHEWMIEGGWVLRYDFIIIEWLLLQMVPNININGFFIHRNAVQ